MSAPRLFLAVAAALLLTLSGMPAGAKPAKPVHQAKGWAPPVIPAAPTGPLTLVMRGLDKITGRPTTLLVPIGKSVQFATLTITARFCYTTPVTETPETAAFVQIEDHRPDQPEHRVFSGWMYASSPGLNGMEHPLYDVWVITCKAIAPGEVAAVAPIKPVKPMSPDATDAEKPAALPEGAGQ